MAIVLAILWVCVSNMHSHVMVWALGAKRENGRSQVRDSVDIFQYWPYVFLRGSLIPLKIQYVDLVLRGGNKVHAVLFL
jgi:hypothetical protein